MAVPAAHETPFTAIASAARRRILDLLAEHERTVSALVEAMRMSQPAVSQHLKVLREAGLVEERVAGRFRVYRLKPEPLGEVLAWVGRYQRFWIERVDALDRVLDEMEK